MKFVVRVNGRMRSIEFSIKIIVGKKTKDAHIAMKPQHDALLPLANKDM